MINLRASVIQRYCNCPGGSSSDTEAHTDSCAIFTFIIDAQTYGSRTLLMDYQPRPAPEPAAFDAVETRGERHDLDAAAIKILSGSDPEPEEIQDDVENPPAVNAEEVHDWLPMSEMVMGRAYTLTGERLTLGWWDGTAFVGLSPSGQLMSEGHWSDEGTAKPTRGIEETTFTSDMDQSLQKEALRSLMRIHGSPTP